MVRLAVAWALVPAARKNKAAELLLNKLARGASWMELLKTVAQLLGAGSYLDLLDMPARPQLVELVRAHDGEEDLGAEALEALLKPFEKGLP